jgi:hypothetical protein
MAVLFSTPFGYTLKADKPAELLQGFVNIQNVEGANTGKLTKANLDSYAQKRFIAADPSSSVASYLNTNFAAIAKLDGDANSISVDDLVQIRSGLPTPPATQDPPSTTPPANGGLGSNGIGLLLLLILQRLFSSFARF